MQLSPRYEGAPIIVLDLPLEDPLTPLVRQRERFAASLAELDDAEWATQSRCEAWSVKDVVVHLSTADRFWGFSVDSARRGEPSRFLDGFDPVATPANLVAGAPDLPAAEVLAELVASTAALAASLADLDADGWDRPGEAPPGHVALRALAAHALWDGWVHERDVLLPLGRPVAEEPDELAACLRYGAALGPAFLACAGSARTGTLVVDATDPAVRCTVGLGRTVRVHPGDAPDGALRLQGRAVDLLEALSRRAPLSVDVPPGDAWMLTGLATAFDQA